MANGEWRMGVRDPLSRSPALPAPVMAMAKAISYAFFVAEAEYPRLQQACPGEFPYSYAEYCARIDASIKETAETVSIEKVYVSVEKFLAWCAETNVPPSNVSRARYAAAVGYPWGRDD